MIIKIKNKVPNEDNFIYSKEIMDAIGKKIYVDYNEKTDTFRYLGFNIPKDWIESVVESDSSFRTKEENELRSKCYNEIVELFHTYSKPYKIKRVISNILAVILGIGCVILLGLEKVNVVIKIIGGLWYMGFLMVHIGSSESYLTDALNHARADVYHKYNISKERAEYLDLKSFYWDHVDNSYSSEWFLYPTENTIVDDRNNKSFVDYNKWDC